MTTPLVTQRERTPAQPGPGPTPEALLRRLDLTIARRVDALLAGDHRSSLLGTGSELAQVRPYQAGEDDVRQMDWNVTARTGQPHVRVQMAERVLVTWLLLDTSPSMSFGTADRRKADVGEGISLAVGYAATRRGNRLGLVTFGDHRPRHLAPAQGRLGMLGLMEHLQPSPEEGRPGPTSLGEALRRVAGLARQRSAIVVVSDFRGPRDWRGPILDLASRHDVLAIEVRDPREQELPDLGELRLVDPETGRQLRVDTGNRRLRERFAAAAAQERVELGHELANAGIDHLILSTSGEWLRGFARFLKGRNRRRRR